MKRLLFQLFAIFVLAVPATGSADWGKEPAYEEINRYSNASIGFASQDLKSPVSNFGHTFLVFHNSDPPEADALVIEFTGEAPDLLANISAFFTSVPGKYTPTYLSEKRRAYDYENRNIWLYKLSLGKDELQALKQYLLQSKNTTFAYDFSQKNCAFYIAKAITHSRYDLEFKQDGLFVTPVNTLRWARSKNIISSEICLPSTQYRALSEYEALSDTDQKITIDLLTRSTKPFPEKLKKEIGNTLSAISEHLIQRESDSSNRNYLYTIKRDFPLSATGVLNAEDPSRSTGLASISTLLLPQINASIFTLSPGFIRLENETASGLKNSTIEVLKTDLYVASAGSIRLEQFHLATIESNQPSGYLRDGFTQALDISYANYRIYLNKNYKETKLLFGRGGSWLFGGNTISLLPLGSIVESSQDSGISGSGRIEMRLNIYKQLNEYVTYAAQVDQLITHNSEIRQTVNLDLIHAVGNALSISLNVHRVKGVQQASTLLGLKLTASF